MLTPERHRLSRRDDMNCNEMVVLGRVGAPYGVRGWLKLQAANSAQPEGLLDYPQLRLDKGGRRERLDVESGRLHGKGMVVKFSGISSRESAAAWSGALVGVARRELPPLGSGEYYWHDLIGLQVLDEQGGTLGEVTRLLETGAHDLLVVRTQGQSEILVPYVRGDVVKRVDLEGGVIVVCWDPEY